jgi:nucleotide-binding universal stress UspA family protein
VTYASLMVHLELGKSNAGLLKIAGNLATRFQAGVIGITTCQPIQLALNDGYVTGEVIQQDLKEIEKEIATAEAEFRAALQSHVVALEWRSAVVFTSLYDYLAREARAADLVITKVDRTASVFDSSRHLNTGDLVMQAGRPILIVPTTADKLDLDHVLLGWRDTREARRAAADALPLLREATRVTVVEIVPEEELPAAEARLKDVDRWLRQHGIEAEFLASPSRGGDAHRLDAIAQELGADLVVAGAYGHSRLREWVFGGVTRNLLLGARRCALVSH